MYERIKKVKGRIYSQLVEKRKGKDGKVRQVVVIHLGGYDILFCGFQKLQAQYFALRQGRESEYFTREEGGLWNAIADREIWLREDEKAGYVRSDAWQKENDMVASWYHQQTEWDTADLDRECAAQNDTAGGNPACGVAPS